MRNILRVYTPDYSEICRFKNEFERFEPNMTLLRENIFNWLGKKDDKEIEDIETMLIVEIEEINKFSLQFSIFSVAMFIFGIMSTMYEKAGKIYVFLVILIVMLVILTSGMKRATRYHKYYIFMKQMVSRYKKDK